MTWNKISMYWYQQSVYVSSKENLPQWKSKIYSLILTFASLNVSDLNFSALLIPSSQKRGCEMPFRIRSFHVELRNALSILFMMFNATFNNMSVISWRSVLLVGGNRVPGENHRPVASHWQIFFKSISPRHERDSNSQL
jgi:hypothetical protein